MTTNNDNIIRGIGGYLEVLIGTDGADVFDANVGGIGQLEGGLGDDVYWLGRGTENDLIFEEGGDNEIRIKAGISEGSVRLARVSRDLYVQLLDADGMVTDSLAVFYYYVDGWRQVERVVFDGSDTVWERDVLNRARIIGTYGDDFLLGTNGADIFDSDAGGNDNLYGVGGDDVYWLGRGTGDDRIWGGGDEIRIKANVDEDSVRLVRSGHGGSDLRVELLDAEGLVTDSLTVFYHYVSPDRQVERVVFDGSGIVLDKNDFPGTGRMMGRIVGTSGNDRLYGASGADVFDGNIGGDDELHGGNGDDVYWLGRDTGHDRIVEGGGSDEIRIKEGINEGSVHLQSNGPDLLVQLLSADGTTVTDSLTVVNHYSSGNGQVERVVFAGIGVVWEKNDFPDRMRIVGTSSDEILEGSGGDDMFDANAGSDNELHGGGGNDIYWLGFGTGHDRIIEGGGSDEIRIKEGISESLVKLSRNEEDLLVQLLGADGMVADSLTVLSHYASGYAYSGARVERVVFDGADLVWEKNDFPERARIVGTSGNDILYGMSSDGDIFDANAGGDDELHGGDGGNDIYWLGFGTGHDRIIDMFGDDEIRIKEGINEDSVRLFKNGMNLQVQLLDGDLVTDSLTVVNHYVLHGSVSTIKPFQVERVVFDGGDIVWERNDFPETGWIAGTNGDDTLQGTSGADEFDANTGGNDELHGGYGDDVYWLGFGTGHDRIVEEHSDYYGVWGDEIRIKADISGDSVRLVKNGWVLQVQLLDSNDAVTDSLTVIGHYMDASAKVERVVFTDGSGIEWGADEFAEAQLVGDRRNNSIVGTAGGDVFDANAGGDDNLYGRGGNDVYWLGYGTGNDGIREYDGNDGDTADEIRIKVGISDDSVRLLRRGADLLVQLLAEDGSGTVTDSLTVVNHYAGTSERVERVVLADGSFWNTVDYVNGDARVFEERLGGDGGDGDVNGASDADRIDAIGGDNRLYGFGGNDVYWLGYGTGDDQIDESRGNAGGDADDEIRIKAGVLLSSVRLVRSGDGRHLYVQLLDEDGDAVDSLKVRDYYVRDSAKIERVSFYEGTEWDAADLATARIIGDADNNELEGGEETNDVFDSNGGGSDELRGRGGNDVYWLGDDTDHDSIHEYDREGDVGDTDDEIRIKRGIDASSVHLLRSEDGADLRIQLLGDNGAATNSLTVVNYYVNDAAKVERVTFYEDGLVWDATDLVKARIIGDSGDEKLYGEYDVDNVFDSNGGGNDDLYGRGGDNVYWLGYGTGKDRIHEYEDNDAFGGGRNEIRIKDGIETSSVRLSRSADEAGADLRIQLLDNDGAVMNSLTVVNYRLDNSAKVESVVFVDGTIWGADEFARARIVGGGGDDELRGEYDVDNVFDSSEGGNDNLYGYGGDDVYWLGYGTGKDRIYETGAGDAGDKIRIKAGIEALSVRLARDAGGNNLRIELLDENNELSGDSLTVVDYYKMDAAKVESVVLGDGAVWDMADLTELRIGGGKSNDEIRGTTGNDIFDSDAGGDDILHGLGGDDVYWLGYGTGSDTIHESGVDGEAGDEIRIKAGIGVLSVRLRRVDEHSRSNLRVELLDENRAVTDSLTVVNYYTDDSARVERVVFTDDSGIEWDVSDFALAPWIFGTNDDDTKPGTSGRDIFDTDAGGNDLLYDFGGDDVYWLGYGTGNDTIHELVENAGDEIRIEAGISVSSIRLARSGENDNDLRIELLNSVRGLSGDSLTVANYYGSDSAKVERVVLADGTVWDAEDLSELRIVGSRGDDDLHGTAGADIFDSDAGGNDNLYGGGGDDVYWLGYGTGNDTIREFVESAGDEIRIKAGIGVSSVLLSEEGGDLLVSVFDETNQEMNSLRVAGHFSGNRSAQVESIYADGKVLLESQYRALIEELALFAADNSRFGDDEGALRDHFWRDEDSLAASP